MTNNPDPFEATLVAIITADTLDQVADVALQATVAMLAPRAACLLVWDTELERYIVGATWSGAEAPLPPPELRRAALRSGAMGHAHDAHQAQVLANDVLYTPYNTTEQHVGALIAWGADSGCFERAQPRYTLLAQTIARALYTVTRLEQAERDHTQLEADRERLEELLHAVERQQRMIDDLLAIERRFSASLEAEVEQRTQALKAAQVQLIQSEKLAVIGQLASSLAHELNNPLQAIQSGLGLVLMELEGEHFKRTREDLRIMQEELERIESIFRQMLDFYRPARQDVVPLDLNAICEGVRVLMRKRLQEGCVALRLELADSLPLTCGDSNQIKQVVINLVLNAADAMPEVGGTITLRTVHNAHYASIAVVDDGCGIAPEHLAQLFEPLFTTKTRGLGLGLAISREIAQRHGGQIDVQSTVGVGTEFTLALPVKEKCHNGETGVGR